MENRIVYLPLKSFSKYNLLIYISKSDQISGEAKIKNMLKQLENYFIIE